jgi:DNA-binding MarR family transcriptional regulator
MHPSTHHLARTLIHVIPKSMWLIRYGMRDAARDEFSVPQFRVLAQLFGGPRTNSDLALQIGISVPAMSRLVDGLVKAGWVTRVQNVKDRRQSNLKMTAAGNKRYLALQEQALASFELKLSHLNEEQQRALAQGLSILEELSS